MQAKDLKDWPVLSSIGTSNIRKAFVFANAALVQENDGTIFGFGRNDHYLLGNNSESTNYNRISVSSTKFKDFTTNGEHGLAISEEGFLYSWGSNVHGQLGRAGERHPVSLATKVFAVKIKEAACGTGFSCVLSQDGRVFIPSFPQATNKCNLCLHSKKMNALEGPMKNKKIIQVLSGKRYAFALSSSGEIFLWTLCCDIADDPEQLSIRIGRVVKLWASSSHDVLVAANHLGNLYSITWSECGILLSVTQINFSSAGKYFAKLKMQMDGPVYDQGTFNFDSEESADVLSEWRGRFEAAFNRKEDSDVTFIVGGGFIYAHRAILSIQSSYLNAILKNEWKENSDNKSP
ncbi:hypothetical protein J437_LFUL000493 [Ladona fulva]|uniref:BTB domain-containing protein n=1 Tax=Ladona fulva TaxID=123851 RepID=A0A8K0NWA5_LADFU|nr:hypothetical protein J437_LFUL000493 [Ladona fulva]